MGKMGNIPIIYYKRVFVSVDLKRIRENWIFPLDK